MLLLKLVVSLWRKMTKRLTLISFHQVIEWLHPILFIYKSLFFIFEFKDAEPPGTPDFWLMEEFTDVVMTSWGKASINAEFEWTNWKDSYQPPSEPRQSCHKGGNQNCLVGLIFAKLGLHESEVKKTSERGWNDLDSFAILICDFVWFSVCRFFFYFVLLSLFGFAWVLVAFLSLKRERVIPWLVG